MAIETWWVDEITVAAATYRLFISNSQGANVPEAATTVSIGWQVGKTAASYSDLNNGAESSTFGATILPNTTVPAAGRTDTVTGFSPPDLYSTAVALSTMYPYNGYFPAGNWSIRFGFRAQTAAASGVGRMNVRVFKGSANFTNVTELTGALQAGTTITNLLTTATQFSTVTWAAPVVQLNNQYLYIKVGWQITTASGSNSADINFRQGNTCYVQTTNFQPRTYTIT